MTNPSNKIRDFPDNFYFWLGEDGEMESLTAEEFQKKQDELVERERKWKDVDVVSGD